MNWAAATILSWIALGLDVGLASALQLGDWGVRPAFTIIVLAYVSCHAPRQEALWLSLVLGVVMDLTHESFSPASMGTVTIVGPHALGCVAASMLVMTLRGSIMRSSLLAMAFLGGVSVLAVHLVVVSMIEARSWYDGSVAIHAGAGLWRGVLIAVYTSVVALVLSPLLGALGPVLSTGHGTRWR
ncbi:MAG: hypothetical protein ACF8GE_02950 [Phycisphaerales bacterium JB043]